MGKKGSSTSAAPVEQKDKDLENAVEQKDELDIRVKIDKLFNDETKKLKAFASANIGPFAVHGIRVFENEKGMFVNMPSNSYKDAQGNTQYEDIFHPVTKEARDKLVDSVIGEYKHALEQAQNQNAVPHNSNAVQTQNAQQM